MTSPDPTPVPAAPATPRAITLSAATVATSLLLSISVLVPLPYVVASPGPTRDTLGEFDGTPLISIDGVPTYEPSGELLLTTVSYGGGPGYPVGLADVLRGWWSSSRSVRPVETVYHPSETREDIERRTTDQMIGSQEAATVAALHELGHEVPARLVVPGTVPGSGADGVVQPGDVVVALDGEDLVSYVQLDERMDDVVPGTDVVLGVERDGARHDLTVTTSDDGTGNAVLGVYIAPEFDLPFDVSIEIETIGGSSAGTMFALGIIDKLTEADETNGQVIAGTGEIELTGEVGGISGIRHKLAGAERDGARWFLAPEANCDEVVGHVPDGLSVVAVSTLSEARAAVEAIGAGNGETLPTCS